jgi:hypothetical protein
MRTLLTLIMVLALVGAARADVFIDDFENGINLGGWSYNAGDIIETEGGNPGGWLHNPEMLTFGPIFNGDWNAPEFTGDFRALGVTEISWDARLDIYSIPIGMCILLRDGKGTPFIVDDDDYAYFVGPLIPPADGNWYNYVFPIPSDDTSDVPDGWYGGWVGDLEHFRPGVTWNDVIQNVERVELWFWHPAYYGIIVQWGGGIDNVAITKSGVVATEQATWSDVKALFR